MQTNGRPVRDGRKSDVAFRSAGNFLGTTAWATARAGDDLPA